MARFGPNVATQNWRSKPKARPRKKGKRSIFFQRRKPEKIPRPRQRGKRTLPVDCSDAPDEQADAQGYQSSINADWDASQLQEQDKREAFPELPSQQRVQASLADFRMRVSTPHLSQACCAVCGEQWNASLIRTFSPGDSFLCNGTMKLMQILLTSTHAPPPFVDGITRVLFSAGLTEDRLAGPFQGMALSAQGVDRDKQQINMCKRCYNSLKGSRRTPHLAVANNLDFGCIPPELQGLSWTEERVISLYRVSVHVLNLRSHESPSHRSDDSILHQQLKVKGHSFCVSQDIPSVHKALPVHPDELPEIIQVSRQP